MGIGTERDVNAIRLLFFFEDTVCVYPAQSFATFSLNGAKVNAQEWTTTTGNFWDQSYTTAPDNYYIERNARDYFPPEDGSTSNDKFVTYYTAINPNKKNEGIIGL